MPAELDSLIDTCMWRYNAAYGDGSATAGSIQLAGGYLYDHDWERAGTSLLNAAANMGSFRETMTTYYSYLHFYIIDTLQWISDNWPEAEAPPEITMANIVSAMFAANNEELKSFIALVDAFRQSLWSQPFDAEYWAAIARGFEIWG